jgi:hypothetical protein
MNTSKYIRTTEAREFKVQLKGAYEGNYRVFIHIEIPVSGFVYEVFVFTDTKIPVHIQNQDIVDLIIETINTTINTK